jgi:hypothetical protein
MQQRYSCVVKVAQGNIEGRRIRRYRVILGNDEALADEIIRHLNVRFALGDVSSLTCNAKDSQAKEEASKTTDPTFGEWAEQWLDSHRGLIVSRRAHQNYGHIVRSLCHRVGESPLASVDRSLVLDLLAELEREGKNHRTVVDTLGVLRLVLRDARERELIRKSPLDRSLPKRTTKAVRASCMNRVTFRPFIALELERRNGRFRSGRHSQPS